MESTPSQVSGEINWEAFDKKSLVEEENLDLELALKESSKMFSKRMISYVITTATLGTLFLGTWGGYTYVSNAERRIAEYESKFKTLSVNEPLCQEQYKTRYAEDLEAKARRIIYENSRLKATEEEVLRYLMSGNSLGDSKIIPRGSDVISPIYSEDICRMLGLQTFK